MDDTGVRWIEFEANEDVIVKVRIKDKMDAASFMQMMNTVKPFIKLNTTSMGGAPTVGGPRKPIDLESPPLKQAAKLFKDGMSKADIARETGKSYGTIYTWEQRLKAAGVI